VLQMKAFLGALSVGVCVVVSGACSLALRAFSGPALFPAAVLLSLCGAAIVVLVGVIAGWWSPKARSIACLLSAAIYLVSLCVLLP
jgi:hypothetical protein